MSTEYSMEHLYQRIELVRGVGDRWRRQLCVMSLVALLSGERHTDNPQTASVVICRFAIPINDAMPSAFRRRLKPFAPRIVGTKDGLDRTRGQLLMRAVATEILPRILADFRDPETGYLNSNHAAADVNRASELLRLCARFTDLPLNPRKVITSRLVAHLAARLLAYCGRNAGTEKMGEWYWLTAVGLLDRLCDVGADRRRKVLDTSYFRGAFAYLGDTASPQPDITSSVRETEFGDISPLPSLVG